MIFREFKEIHKGGFYLYAAEDIPGFYKKGSPMYGDCDDMVVVDYLYQPLNGIHTVYLKNDGRSEKMSKYVNLEVGQTYSCASYSDLICLANVGASVARLRCIATGWTFTASGTQQSSDGLIFWNSSYDCRFEEGEV